ncbi:MAG TPA: branched-chain amino acid ABC transporter permease [bacterium]|nr:branched-chain amino acid ABC transporter permease [bacterium]
MSFFSQIVQYVLSGLVMGSSYALIALGYTIIYNGTNIINFAQGEFVVIGSLMMVTLTTVAGLPLLPAFFISVAVTVVVAFLLERLAVYPLRNSDGMTLIIVTIGASIFLRGISMFIWGKNAYALKHFSGDTPVEIMGATILPQSFWVFGITILCVVGLQLFYKHTLTGKAMLAAAINKTAARLMGINVENILMLSFILSGALGSVAGIIIAPITLARYDAGLILGLKGFCACVLGGLGSSTGAIVGGILLGVLESLGAGLISSGYKDAIAFVILLLVLFLKPQGLLPLKEMMMGQEKT